MEEYYEFTKKILNVFGLVGFILLLWAMDLTLRYMGQRIDFCKLDTITPNAFTLTWALFFAWLIASLKGKLSKIIYWVVFIIYWLLFLTHGVYYSLTNFFFSFHLTKMASEGSSYILSTIVSAPKYIYGLGFLFLVIAIILSFCIQGREKNHPIIIVMGFGVFLVLHSLSVKTMGTGNTELSWSNFEEPKNVYDNFSDANKGVKLAGLYEYTVRNFYVTFLRPAEEISTEDEAFLQSYYDKTGAPTNEYTGLFKGKNVIFLQLEGMDDWLLNEKDTPNLYKLRQQSMNFTDHYSTYTGGGSTFNSEFSVNTGFTTPLTYNENVYSLNHNDFSQSLAHLFKNLGYRVNAFHMNSPEFYSRGVNYKNWGYDNYFNLIDIMQNSSQGLDYELDRQLILDETFNKEMFKSGEPFLDYIITYTPHTPFTTTEGIGKLVSTMKYGEGNVPDLSEEEVVRLEVSETDYMVGLLIQALKDNNLYDNTVIVAFADHYLYTINDKSVLDKYKNTTDQRINHTPFFIWSSDLKAQEVDKPSMQVDILPTTLNLFGVEYTKSYYIGEDVLDSSYRNFVFYTDHAWYDGTTYSTSSSEKVENLIKKNDLTLRYNYFANIN
ncbi:Sulfatase [Lachnospiraceae bacterium TWA4]|nr:Sulfatase [Lachnospiraceae bacterium TWA4]